MTIEWTDVKAPLKACVPVTPDDEEDLPDGTCRCLIVSDDCVLNIVEADGTERTSAMFFKGYNPKIVKRVMTGADAASVDIEAGY